MKKHVIVNLMENSAKIYRKLQQRLDKLPIGYPATESGVEMRILRYLFTPKEARIATKLSFLPERIEKIYKRTKKYVQNPEELQQILDRMAEKGSIVRHTTRHGFQIYSVTMLAIGMFEFQVDKLTKEFYSDFLQYLNEEFREEVFTKKLPQLRPIPTGGSITPDLPILPYDDIRKIVPNLKEPILVANCICKQGHDMIGKPCKVTDKREICIIIGSGAKNYKELGWGRYITKEEVLQILKEAEQDGLVVQPSNSKKPFVICLCCGCCCEVLTSTKKLNNPASYFTSNYEATVNTELCIGCGICEDRCQMEAIEIIDGISTIDYSRCIGCGLCVTNCSPQAITLQRKTTPIEPPENPVDLYLNILKHKMNNAQMLIMLTKRLLGMKI